MILSKMNSLKDVILTLIYEVIKCATTIKHFCLTVSFWGVSLKNGKGLNHLGEILMKLRRSFSENGVSAAQDA